MDWIAQEIPAVQVIDINVVGVEPSYWPRVDCVEPIAAVLKTSRPVGEFAAVHMERVARPKLEWKRASGMLPLASRGLCPIGLLSALPLLCRPGLFLLRGALGLLSGLGLLRGALRLLCWPGLLRGALRLLRWPGLLRGALRLLRWPGLLRGVLLMLCRLGWLLLLLGLLLLLVLS